MGAAEGKIERALVDRIHNSGGLCIKLTGYKGIPDRMCLLPNGHIVFVELKSSTGSMSEAQRLWKLRLLDLGYNCVCIHNKEMIDSWFPKEGNNG